MWLWVRRWLIRPIQAWEARAHVEHRWFGPVVKGAVSRASSTARFHCASKMHLDSAALAPVRGDFVVRSWTIHSKCVPCVDVDTQLLEGRFEGVFVALFLFHSIKSICREHVSNSS